MVEKTITYQANAESVRISDENRCVLLLRRAVEGALPNQMVRITAGNQTRGNQNFR